MQVTLRLANDVRRLGRDGMTVGEIAATLGRSEADILSVLIMLGLPLPGERVDPATHTPNDEERAAIRAKMPKKWQDRRSD